VTSAPGVASGAAAVHTGRKWPRPPPGDGLGRAAAAIGAAAWAWHAAVVLRAYFVQDDCRYLHDAAHTPLTPGYLWPNYHGNLMPGQFLLVWLVDRIAPLNHTVAVAPVLALAAVAMALMWSCLVALCGRRPALLVRSAGSRWRRRCSCRRPGGRTRWNRHRWSRRRWPRRAPSSGSSRPAWFGTPRSA
jgi:hypothetical protein